MSRGRSRRELGPSDFTTHIFSLAKPPSVSRGRVHQDMREEKVGFGTQQMTAWINIYLI
jgi:hypothetical protein